MHAQGTWGITSHISHHAYAHGLVRTHTHSPPCICMHACMIIPCIHAHDDAYTHPICMCDPGVHSTISVYACSCQLHINMHACMHVCKLMALHVLVLALDLVPIRMSAHGVTHALAHPPTHAYSCMHVHGHACEYAHSHTYSCTCMHTHGNARMAYACMYTHLPIRTPMHVCSWLSTCPCPLSHKLLAVFA